MSKPDRDWLFLASGMEGRPGGCLQCHERDIGLALALLEGSPKRDRGKQLLKFMPLSARTEPTEKEAREALCRVLLSIAFDYPPDDKRSRVLGTLISVFSSLKPSFPILRPSPFKAVLKRHNQSREDPWRDLAIAMAVKNRRAGGLSYHAATAEVAEAFGYKDTRHVKAIYGRWRPRLGEPPVASDKPTSDMMPDS